MLLPACHQPAKHGWLVLKLSTSSVRHLINLNQTEAPLAAEDGAAVNLFFSAQQFPLRSPSTNRYSVSPCPASAPHPGSCVCPQAGPEGRTCGHPRPLRAAARGWLKPELNSHGSCWDSVQSPASAKRCLAGTHTWLP